MSGPDFRVEGADELRVAQPSEELETPVPAVADETEVEDDEQEHAPGDLRIPEGVGAFVGHLWGGDSRLQLGPRHPFGGQFGQQRKRRSDGPLLG